jgi:histone deacetylase 11
MEEKLPIIFSRRYDVTLGKEEEIHPVDTKRYGRIFTYLVNSVGISEKRFFEPVAATDEDLLLVHTREYLDSLRDSRTIAEIAEFRYLERVPNEILQRRILDSVRRAVGGTILGCRLALQGGWAINLSGGYHHAKSHSGAGFCFFSDIAIAVKRMHIDNEDISVLIIDLDAHQGNGYETIFQGDKRIHIMDVYNEDIFPRDEEAKRYIEYRFPVHPLIDDSHYLSIVEGGVGDAVEECYPDIIIYIAGLDILKGDVLGGMDISEEGVIRRDEIVFQEAAGREIPLVMVLGGGYTVECATITGRSIENILRKIVKV